MRAWAILLAFAAAIPVASVTFGQTIRVLPPEPQKGFEEDHISKAGLAGEEIRIWSAQMLDPDCSAHGAMQTVIIQPPKHGQARISEDPFFGNFPQGNVRYQCNTKKSPCRQVFYTSEPSFHGRDKVVFQNATSEGRIRKWIVDIDMK